MPLADLRIRLPMRDGIRLDTQVWLPEVSGRRPAILLRTPYKEGVLGWRRLGLLRYVEAGYAVVVQLVRGIGQSEGKFVFNGPHDRTDGYDTVEWIAAQGWCDGNVGMDGSSYLGMTQLSAACAQPPHLKCIVPAVPSTQFFREIPYNGGIFSRIHTINWSHLLQIESLAEQRGGFMSALPILTHADYFRRMTSRPLSSAADGELTGDLLQHYLDVLEHPTFDAWWKERTLTAEQYEQVQIPVLMVTGNFDPSVGALGAWSALEASAPTGRSARRLLIGPWDHGQCYVGGGNSYGPYAWPDDVCMDLVARRLRFFDHHLKGEREAEQDQARVTLFVTGLNQWISLDEFPPTQAGELLLHLDSDGGANSGRGDGRLTATTPRQSSAPDVFVDDPMRPFVPGITSAGGSAWPFDMAEYESFHETLVYDSGPLADPLVILGEAEVTLFTSADVPDADLVVHLVERRMDGSSVRLAFGALRLTHRSGVHRRDLLTPGEVVKASIPLTYIAHQLAPGSSLRLLINGGFFPLFDPNPHGAAPVRDAVEMVVARQCVHHDSRHPSRIRLPLAPAGLFSTVAEAE